jgi:hypothetical protein
VLTKNNNYKFEKIGKFYKKMEKNGKKKKKKMAGDNYWHTWVG